LQGENLDIVWADEEPDMSIYRELLGRISGTGGMIMTTFTPLKGMSNVCLRFLNEFDPGRTYIKFGINDLPDDAHIKPEERAAIIASYPSMSARRGPTGRRCSAWGASVGLPRLTSLRMPIPSNGPVIGRGRGA